MWISAFERNDFLRDIWFSRHLFKQTRRRPSLKLLQSFIMIRDDESLSVYLVIGSASQILILATALGIHYLSYSCQINKLTLRISYSIKALVDFHNDASSILVPGINFLEFLVHAVSIISPQLIVYLQSKPVKAILYLQKSPFITK